MAAALRIESAGKEEALALALRHQLLTAQTNCVIVHERAEGEKATDLPQLQKIAQMHAAGWGGVGTVHARQPPDAHAQGRAGPVGEDEVAPLQRPREAVAVGEGADHAGCQLDPQRPAAGSDDVPGHLVTLAATQARTAARMWLPGGRSSVG